MSLGLESKSFVAEMFKQRELRNFFAQDDQLNLAKQSLILKKKCNTNVHSLLFCKSFSDSVSNFSSQNQRRILEEEKLKFFDYVRKNFKQKIPQDFESQNKLKRALKTKIRQLKEKQSKDQVQVGLKRPRMQNQITKNGSKHVKSQKKDKKLQPATAKKDKQKKQKMQQKIQEDDEIQSNNFESDIDLQNDQIDDDQYDGDQNDE